MASYMSGERERGERDGGFTEGRTLTSLSGTFIDMTNKMQEMQLCKWSSDQLASSSKKKKICRQKKRKHVIQN
jgi:hypothetical protein